jgi:hypothetical protein
MQRAEFLAVFTFPKRNENSLLQRTPTSIITTGTRPSDTGPPARRSIGRRLRFKSSFLKGRFVPGRKAGAKGDAQSLLYPATFVTLPLGVAIHGACPSTPLETMQDPEEQSDDQSEFSPKEIEMLRELYAKGLLPRSQKLDQPLVVPKPIFTRVNRICIKRHCTIQQLFWTTLRARGSGKRRDWFSDQSLAFMKDPEGYQWPPDPLDCMLIAGFPHVVSWLVGKHGFKPPPPEA